MNEARSGGGLVPWMKLTDGKKKTSSSPPRPSISLSLFPSSLWTTQEQRTLQQIRHQTRGPTGSLHLHKHSPFSPQPFRSEPRGGFGFTSSRWAVLASRWQMTYVLVIAGWFGGTPMCPSLHSVWTPLSEVILQRWLEGPASSPSVWTSKEQLTFISPTQSHRARAGLVFYILNYRNSSGLHTISL